MAKKPKHIAEFGDFQTPDELALQVVRYAKRLSIKPKSIFEPSCGRGAFLVAAAEVFPDAEMFGLEINSAYLTSARERLQALKAKRVLKQGSFFAEDWAATVEAFPFPLLVIGNPPWVTNSELGALGSDNLPGKSNFNKFKGLDAVTGKSNFDISEWMLIKNIEWIVQSKGVLAVLCKTAVARKVLARAWGANVPITEARIVRVNAMAHFGAAVDACMCLIRADQQSATKICSVFSSFDADVADSTLGFVDDTLVADVNTYVRTRHLRGKDTAFTWRSGVKHDCSKVMEVERIQGGWRNGYGERIALEDRYVFPLMKSSDIGRTQKRDREKWVVVPQRIVGQQTLEIELLAPKTWAYLNAHSAALDARASVIYRNKPRFSVFGVGPYTFAPWKVAISGLYKKFEFRIFGPVDGKPVVFDDTVYFLPFDSQKDAEIAILRLQQLDVIEFFTSMVFWDEKRPITVDLLKRLQLSRLLGLVAGREVTNSREQLRLL
jgi:hypothetical protein